jgi:molybdopterin-guanine dinucleotide biosynthesis protein A
VAGYAAIILAGGAGRRLGAVDKPELTVGGRPLLDRVLSAVTDARPQIVVGPPRELPTEVLTTREDPPGGGPVSALAAGLSLIPGGTDQVALLAADLPFLTAGAVAALRAAADPEAAVYTDGDRRQLLCAVWRLDPLRDRLAALGDPAGLALRQLYADATVTEITSQDHPPPWYDCDTEADLRQAEAWLEGDR